MQSGNRRLTPPIRPALGAWREAFMVLVIVAMTPPAFADPKDDDSSAALAPKLPRSVVKLLDAPELPAISIDPRGRYALLIEERRLLRPADMGSTGLAVAGMRIDPRTNGRHAPLAYVSLTLVDVHSGDANRLALPSDVTIGFPRWASDGSRFLFTVTSASGIELWVGEPGEKRVGRVGDFHLNATLGSPCVWMADDRRVVCRVVKRHGPSAAQSSLSAEHQPMMSSWHSDETNAQLVDRYLTSQLQVIDVVSGKRERVGDPHVIESLEPSPDGRFFLVTRIVPPFPQLSGIDSVSRSIEIWDRRGRVAGVLSDAQREGSIPPSRRAAQWSPSEPATVVWIEGREHSDVMMAQSAPFSTPPMVVHETGHGFSGLRWLEDSSLLLISEYDSARRLAHTWLVDAADRFQSPRRVLSRSVDTTSLEAGRPLTRPDSAGRRVVGLYDNGILVERRNDSRTSLERLALDTLSAERLWESDQNGYERVVGVLDPGARMVLTRHETPDEPANYVIRDLAAGVARRITEREHPAPELREVSRMPLRYHRDDGLELSSTLYVRRDQDSRAPLPLILWAYPRQYGSDSEHGGVDSSERFLDVERSFRLFFLASGYAVMDDVSMPVVGDGLNANDTFLEQVIANAEAAIRAAAATGAVDPQRVGVAGHSFGAFMAANLLAHSHLFRAGLAMSGSYNRTLTPFGFQTERRTLWEAQQTYLELSPILYSDRIEAPLLLVHGLLDQHPGTPPLQSKHLHEAIRRNGGRAELLLLPLEGHSYRGRQSVLAIAAAALDWFDANLKGRDPEVL